MFPDGDATDTERLDLLSQVGLFRNLSRRELLEVDEFLHTRIYEKDETVYEEGDIGHGVFVILSGKVCAFSRGNTGESGRFEFGPGELVGELCLFVETPRIATVVAVERTLTTALFRAELLTIVGKNKNIGVKVLLKLAQILSQRVQYLVLNKAPLPSP